MSQASRSTMWTASCMSSPPPARAAVVIPVRPRPVLAEREHVLGEARWPDLAGRDPPPSLEELGVEAMGEAEHEHDAGRPTGAVDRVAVVDAWWPSASRAGRGRRRRPPPRRAVGGARSACTRSRRRAARSPPAPRGPSRARRQAVPPPLGAAPRSRPTIATSSTSGLRPIGRGVVEPDEPAADDRDPETIPGGASAGHPRQTALGTAARASTATASTASSRRSISSAVL